MGGISRIVLGLSGLILTPILLSGLGKYEYGIWVTISQMTGFILLADLGVANSISRLMSKYDALNLIKNKISIYSSSLATLLVIMVVAILLSLFLSFHISDILKIKEDYREITTVVFLIMAINVALSLPLRIGRGMLETVHRFDKIDFLITLFKIIQIIIILYLYYYHDITLFSVVILIVSINLIVELIIFIYGIKAHQEVKFIFNSISKKTLQELFSISGASLLLTITGFFSNQGLIILISLLLGVLYAPFISIPLFILLSLGSLIGIMSNTFIPIASSYDSLNQSEEIKKLSMYGVRYTLMQGLLISVYIFSFSHDLLSIWLPLNVMTLSDIDTIYSVLVMLIIPFILGKSNQGNRAVLLASGWHWKVSNMSSIISILCFILAALLLTQTSLGIYSVVIALAVKLVFGDLILTTYFVIKKYNIKSMNYFIDSYGKPIFIISAICTLVFLLKIMSNNLIFNSSVYFFFSIFFFFIVLEKKHRKQALNLIKDIFINN